MLDGWIGVALAHQGSQVPDGSEPNMTNKYLINSSNKIAALSELFKRQYIQGNKDEALELIEVMETKLKFMRAELENQMAVSA